MIFHIFGIFPSCYSPCILKVNSLRFLKKKIILYLSTKISQKFILWISDCIYSIVISSNQQFDCNLFAFHLANLMQSSLNFALHSLQNEPNKNYQFFWDNSKIITVLTPNRNCSCIFTTFCCTEQIWIISYALSMFSNLHDIKIQREFSPVIRM